MQDHNCFKACAHLTEIDHRVANHFALLRSFVALKASELRNAREEPSRLSVLLLLEGIATRLDAFANLHRSLAQDRGAMEANVADHLHNICDAYRQSIPENITIEEAFDGRCTLPFERLFSVIQIFSELLTNAIKYGPLGHGPCVIRTSCTKKAHGAIDLDVIDDGRGLSPSFDEGHGGLGVRLVKALAQQLDATVEFNPTPQGLHARLSVPLQPSKAVASRVKGSAGEQQTAP